MVGWTPGKIGRKSCSTGLAGARRNRISTHPPYDPPSDAPLRRSAVCVSERRKLSVCVRAGRRRNFRETISANGDEALENGGGGGLEKWWVGLRGRLGGSLVRQAWQERESLGYRPTHPTTSHPTPPCGGLRSVFLRDGCFLSASGPGGAGISGKRFRGTGMKPWRTGMKL